MKLESYINSFSVFHCSNHDGRGNTHNQYLSKHHFGKTENIGNETGQHIPIARIQYKQDDNYMLKYGFDFMVRPLNERFKIDLMLDVNGVNELTYTRDSSFAIFADYKNLGPIMGGSSKDIGEVVLYAVFYNPFRQGFIQLNHALVYNPTSSGFNMRDEEAFEYCEIYDRAKPVVITPNVSGKGIREPYFGALNQSEVVVAPGEGYDVVISDQDLAYGCIVSVNFSEEFSRSLVISSPTYNITTKEIIVKIRNVSENSYSIPACTVYWMINYR